LSEWSGVIIVKLTELEGVRAGIVNRSGIGVFNSRFVEYLHELSVFCNCCAHRSILYITGRPDLRGPDQISFVFAMGQEAQMQK
jgi:hypothetical protein